jgi:hypothetical protein
VSYHITIHGVSFESIQHLKTWVINNGKKIKNQQYLLGTTKFDVSVYNTGYWRFPLCTKLGANRPFIYDAEPMSLDVFRKLSIHYVEPGARRIQVELSECPTERRTNVTGQKRPRNLHTGVCVRHGIPLTTEEKEKYHLKGDLFWAGGIKHFIVILNRESKTSLLGNNHSVYCARIKFSLPRFDKKAFAEYNSGKHLSVKSGVSFEKVNFWFTLTVDVNIYKKEYISLYLKNDFII